MDDQSVRTRCNSDRKLTGNAQDRLLVRPGSTETTAVAAQRLTLRSRVDLLIQILAETLCGRFEPKSDVELFPSASRRHRTR